MRIKEEYKKSGYFWLPASIEKKIPGILSITDGGKIELEIVGLFDESIEALNGSPHLGRVIGHVEKDGVVTLENCVYHSRHFALFNLNGISKSSVYVEKVLSGVAYEEGEQVLFNTFSFSVEGIDEWIGISGVRIEQFEDFSATITYQAPEEVSFNLDNGMQLKISFSWEFEGFSNITEAKVIQKTYFKLISSNSKNLEEFIGIGYKITNLLCFAIDKTVCLENVSATADDIRMDVGNGKTKPVKIKIYYPSLPFSKEEPKIDCKTMLFRFERIRENAEKIINNWLRAYDEIEPALSLYFSTKTGAYRFLDGRFLALAQGLETYHRSTSNEKLMEEGEFKALVTEILLGCPAGKKDWLKDRLIYGNEINLRNRIKKIIEPYKELIGDTKSRKKLITNIVDTRNYLTHFDKSSKHKAISGGDLVFLCFKMEALLQLHFLQVLGFPKSQISLVLNNCDQLKQKLNRNAE